LHDEARRDELAARDVARKPQDVRDEHRLVPCGDVDGERASLTDTRPFAGLGADHAAGSDVLAVIVLYLDLEPGRLQHLRRARGRQALDLGHRRPQHEERDERDDGRSQHREDLGGPRRDHRLLHHARVADVRVGIAFGDVQLERVRLRGPEPHSPPRADVDRERAAAAR
jgi:hypothetical protein